MTHVISYFVRMFRSLVFVSKVFQNGGWAKDCTPPDLSGFDKLIQIDPTRLHPFLVPWPDWSLCYSYIP